MPVSLSVSSRRFVERIRHGLSISRVLGVLLAGVSISGWSGLLPAQASGKLIHVRLVVAGSELECHEPPVADDTETYAPLDVLKAVGAVGRLSKRGDTVVVTEQSTGRSLEIALARVNGTEMIALSDLGHIVDAVVTRSRHTDRSSSVTVFFCARLISVRKDGMHVQVTASFPIHYDLEPGTAREGPSIECRGAVLEGFRPPQAGSDFAFLCSQVSPDVVKISYTGSQGTVLKSSVSRNIAAPVLVATISTAPIVDTDSLGALKSQAYSGLVGVTRALAHDMVILEIPGRATAGSQSNVLSHPHAGQTQRINEFTSTIAAVIGSALPRYVGSTSNSKPSSQQGNQIAATVGNEVSRINRPESSEPVHLAAGQTSPATETLKVTGSALQQVEIHGLSFITDNSSRARIELSVSGKPNAVVHYIPGTTQMVMEVANATIKLPEQDNGDRDVQHPLVSHLSICPVPDKPNNVRVQINTSRIVGYSLVAQADKLVLDLRIPRNATGALSDKLIVVDPGHGGVASGASGYGQHGAIYEKSITLAIAMKLRTILEQCGARVVVTRDADVDVPLYDRPKLANTIGADLFISIHNDSTPHTNSASGTTTYYHSSDPSSRALAMCVQDAVRGVTGLPSKGALSDTALYATGFAVLRCSTMPAVLCEVAYINNIYDRGRLVDPAFQQRVAQAMCDGLRNYVEGRPRPVIRDNPSALPPTESVMLHQIEPTH